MSNIPENLQYSKSHEWVKVETAGEATIGITDHAQHALGDMVFVDLPKVGAEIMAGKECAVVESVKSASDVYAPLSGEVTLVNEEVASTPALLNQDPYIKGWLFKVKVKDVKDLDGLMDSKAYAEFVEKESQ